jgi:hypothetical protein
LNGFAPSPPYKCFASRIANAVPLTINHHGARGGRHNASNVAVTMALPSFKNSSTGLRRSRSAAASASKAVNEPSAICISRPTPKNITCSATVGSNAYRTIRMTRPTLSGATT